MNDLLASLDNVLRGQSVPSAKLREMLRKEYVVYARGQVVVTKYGQTVYDSLKRGS